MRAARRNRIVIPSSIFYFVIIPSFHHNSIIVLPHGLRLDPRFPDLLVCFKEIYVIHLYIYAFKIFIYIIYLVVINLRTTSTCLNTPNMIFCSNTRPRNSNRGAWCILSIATILSEAAQFEQRHPPGCSRTKEHVFAVRTKEHDLGARACSA